MLVSLPSFWRDRRFGETDNLSTFWLMGDKEYDLLWWWIANAEWFRPVQFHESFGLWKTGQKTKEIQWINRLICQYWSHEFKSWCPRGINWGNNKSFIHRRSYNSVEKVNINKKEACGKFYAGREGKFLFMIFLSQPTHKPWILV